MDQELTAWQDEILGKAPPSLADVRARHKPLMDINAVADSEVSRLDRLAMWITDHVGTMGFFLAIFVWTTLWLAWNFLAPPAYRFDPPMSFVFWLFISNCIQILLMPLIMVGQNLQGRHSELRAQNDYEVNVKAEEEIEVLMGHLEYQNALLKEIYRRTIGELPEPSVKA